MNTSTDILQSEIAHTLNELIPAEYKKAWVYYEGGNDVTPFFWFCYTDAKTDNLIPSDRITKRKDLVIYDENIFAAKRIALQVKIQELQKIYETSFGKIWYRIIIELSSDGKFNISFDYNKPTGSVINRRDEWCKTALGTVPIVTVDMLRK